MWHYDCKAVDLNKIFGFHSLFKWMWWRCTSQGSEVALINLAICACVDSKTPGLCPIWTPQSLFILTAHGRWNSKSFNKIYSYSSRCYRLMSLRPHVNHFTEIAAKGARQTTSSFKRRIMLSYWNCESLHIEHLADRLWYHSTNDTRQCSLSQQGEEWI